LKRFRLVDLLPGARRARDLDPCGHCFRGDRARQRISARQLAKHARLGVVLTFGQSQLANEGAADARLEAAEGVHALNIFDGAVTAARDPLPGATQDRANLSTRIGERLVRRGLFDAVLLAPIAYGGSAVAEWTPGGRLFPRIEAAATAIDRLGLRVTCALWQQGETDAILATDGRIWESRFGEMIAGLRGLSITAPVFVARSTLCCGPANETIRAAQLCVVDAANGVFPGPDTDALGPDMRFDGCHFSGEGLDRAADLWIEALTAALKS